MKALVVLLAISALALADDSTKHTCECTNAQAVCLTEEQMASHAMHIEMNPDVMGNHVNLSGIAVFEVTFGKDGKVLSASAVSGHSLAIQHLIEAVPKWRFNPMIRNGSPMPACGRLRLKFTIVENLPSVAIGRPDDFQDCAFDRDNPIRISDYFTEANTLESAKPIYPREVIAKGIKGKVAVGILIDFQTGAVVKACAYSGPPELWPASEEAATKFRFRKPSLSTKKYAVDFLIFDFVLPDNAQ